mgnify:CR=1 FL=1
MSSIKISPSILSADFSKLGNEVISLEKAGADYIHIDVMDGHFVPNLTIGPMVCKSLKSYGIKKPIDVHLMTTPVDDLIIQFCDAGASMVSVHPEATQHIDRSIELVKSRDCRAGIALNPASPLSLLDHILDKIDFVKTFDWKEVKYPTSRSLEDLTKLLQNKGYVVYVEQSDIYAKLARKKSV